MQIAICHFDKNSVVNFAKLTRKVHQVPAEENMCHRQILSNHATREFVTMIRGLSRGIIGCIVQLLITSLSSFRSEKESVLVSK